MCCEGVGCVVKEQGSGAGYVVGGILCCEWLVVGE